MADFKLPGLHNIQDKKCNILEKYRDYRLIEEFISNTTQFYKKHFHELNDFVLREKRSLVFETPSRVKICHEYDLFQKKKGIIMPNSPYFIINPTERLAWLKMFCDSERITVARADIVKNVIIEKLQSEIDVYCINEKREKNAVIKEIWAAKQGLPCFIIFSKKPEQSFILEMQFYESIAINKSQNNMCNLICPIQIWNISYCYNPLSNQTSWIYLQSPQNFEIELYENEENLKLSSDPEVVSYAFTDKLEHVFNIKIKVAKTLIIWYLSIYYSALFLFFLILSVYINTLWNKYELPSFNLIGIEMLLPKDTLTTIAALISAGIITTRSFMITEETILKKYSMLISSFLVLIIVLSTLMTVVCPSYS